jgi:hypothetical protein
MPASHFIFPAVAAALVAGLAHAGDPVKLGKADIEKALAGKSISYSNANGAATVVNFEKDGRATYKAGNAKPSVGTWQAGDDGRYCIKITSGTVQDHCRRLWKTDSGYALGGANGELTPIDGLE